MQQKSAQHLEQGNQFLEANGKKENVVTTASGLQYEILTEGTGPKPGSNSMVTVHYEGSLLDGKVFDSSYKRNQPATFGVRQVISGWTEALQLMPQGSKWRLFIPANLGYGSSGTGPIPGNAVLIFDVELLAVK